MPTDRFSVTLRRDPPGAAARRPDDLDDLDDRRRALAEAFMRQILLCHDPDVVATFLEWRDDPRLASLLELAAAIGDEERDQLLFHAEDLYRAAR